MSASGGGQARVRWRPLRRGWRLGLAGLVRALRWFSGRRRRYTAVTYLVARREAVLSYVAGGRDRHTMEAGAVHYACATVEWRRKHYGRAQRKSVTA
jgi:hypothetical protein